MRLAEKDKSKKLMSLGTVLMASKLRTTTWTVIFSQDRQGTGIEDEGGKLRPFGLVSTPNIVLEKKAEPVCLESPSHQVT